MNNYNRGYERAILTNCELWTTIKLAPKPVRKMFSSAFVVLREKVRAKLNLQSTNMHGFKFSIASDKTKDDSLLKLHLRYPSEVGTRI